MIKTTIPNELFSKFFNLVIRLEPENLHMDGEASPSESRKREGEILREWIKLETTLGRRVEQGEIFDTYWQKRRNGNA